MKFIHTADLQLGKPYGSIEDGDKRRDLQRARMDTLARIGEVVREQQAAFVLIAGDLFDSPTPDKATVAQACAAIGEIGVPVLAIPGNHDHGGPGSLWGQPFFLAEQAAHAPNLHVLLGSDPVQAGGAWIFPCPLLTRHETSDLTEHLRSRDLPEDGLPRIVLAHGSVIDFGSSDADQATNRIQLEKLLKTDGQGPARIDYVALGDWHGVKQINPRAWYAGAHEQDRFPKNADYLSGRVLCVEIAVQGALPTVTPIPIGQIAWKKEELQVTTETDLEAAFAPFLPQGDQVNKIALQLTLKGETGFTGMTQVKTLLDQLKARAIHLDLADALRLRPSDDEIAGLADRAGDPLISRVAKALIERNDAGDKVAAHALGELYAAVNAR